MAVFPALATDETAVTDVTVVWLNNPQFVCAINNNEILVSDAFRSPYYGCGFEVSTVYPAAVDFVGHHYFRTSESNSKPNNSIYDKYNVGAYRANMIAREANGMSLHK